MSYVILQRGGGALGGIAPIVFGDELLEASLLRKRGGGDGVPGNNFSDEDYAAARFAGFFAADVEAQIYFIEIGMERDGERAEKFGAAEAKTHQADVSSSVERIERCAGRDVFAEHAGIGFVVQ